MKILNLVDIDKSDIKYQISRFPDGQQQVTILSNVLRTIEKEPVVGWTERIQIKARLNNFKDLELIVCTVASLRGLGVKEIHLYTPYFLGSRSDRKFEEGSNNYLKDIICPIINSLKLDSIVVLDPHSDVLEACLNDYKKIDNTDLLQYALSEIIIDNKLSSKYSYTTGLEDHFVFISPDAGASKKIYKLAESVKYKGEIITCSKDRDTEGKLTKCVVPMGSLWNSGKDAIIIDDICDGGATFINISKELEANGWKGKIYLVVTHGIFSKGFKDLSEYFDGIYSTNSYRDVPIKEWDGDKRDIPTKIKQLNVF